MKTQKENPNPNTFERIALHAKCVLTKRKHVWFHLSGMLREIPNVLAFNI